MELCVKKKGFVNYKTMNTSQEVLLDDQLLRKILRIHSFILFLVLFQFDNELPPHTHNS